MVLMETIAFLPLTRTNWPIMVRLAQALKNCDDARVRPVLVLSNRLTKTLAVDLANGIECVEVRDFPGPALITEGNGPDSRRSKAKAVLWTIARSKWLTPILTWYKSLVVLSQLNMARRLLKDIRPRAVVIPGDRNTGFEPAVLRAARDLGIVLIIPPTAFSATVDGLFIARRQDSGHKVTHRAKFKRRFANQWRHDVLSGEDLSYYGVATTHSYAHHGMLSSNPWVLGGGLSDWILVESEYVKRRYIALDVVPEKIVVTGHSDYDELAASLRERNAIRAQLVDKYQLDPAKKILVLCLVNWAEVGMKSWEWHWQENEFLCGCATQLDCNVLLSLHPSQQRDRYAFLEARYRPLRLLDERLATALPAADIYVTGLSSSTVPWAVLSSVPTVLADHYPEKDHIHLGLPGVIHVTEAADFEGTLERLVNDENHFQELRRAQQASGNLYGNPDGKAMKRIIQMLLTAQPRSHQERFALAT